MVASEPALAGKRVLVTGADGFIGSHVVERLVTDGAAVRAFCLYTSNGGHGWLDEMSADNLDEVEFLLGDIRDADRVLQAVRGCDVVLHLAALVSVPYSYEAPASFIDTNVTGTHNILQAARQVGIDRIVHTSTSEVYGTPRSLPITEDHPLQGQSPYSASKIAADKLCEAWACSFDLPVTVLRPFNTFGPRQSPRAVVVAIALQLLRGTNPVRIGSTEPRRDFTYVSDTVDGFIRAAGATLAPGTVVHLGTGQTVSVGEIFDRLQEIIGTQAEVVSEAARVRPAASEVQVLQSNPSRAAELLGWSPQVAFDDGLRRTVDWLRDRSHLMDSDRYYR